MQVNETAIDEIYPYDKNPRNNKNAISRTAQSIKEFGFQQPIVVDKDGVIIVGHTRYEASKKLKLKKVPVVVADNLNDEQVKAYRLADNKTHDFSEWDEELLDSELSDILDLDMTQFGFDDLEEEIEETEEKDISDNLLEKFQIIIDFEDEEDLERSFNKLQDEGYQCKISTL